MSEGNRYSDVHHPSTPPAPLPLGQGNQELRVAFFHTPQSVAPLRFNLGTASATWGYKNLAEINEIESYTMTLNNSFANAQSKL
ncbi:hypothetical protein R69608_03214 [Paraburkholderia nemoris]|nr:hypothetical protein R69608_03214 [Paraburkholderia nemoris]